MKLHPGLKDQYKEIEEQVRQDLQPVDMDALREDINTIVEFKVTNMKEDIGRFLDMRLEQIVTELVEKILDERSQREVLGTDRD